MKFGKYRYITFSILISLCFTAKAEKLNTNVYQVNQYNEDSESPHCVSFGGSVTSVDSWQYEFAYYYMFIKFIGFGGSVGSWEVYYIDDWASGSNWRISEEYRKPSNFYIRPSLMLKSPAVKYRACQWAIFAQPGAMLNIPYQRVCVESTPNWPKYDYDYVSTTKGQWLAMDLRVGINITCGPCGLNVGYLISNHDVYSQYRHLSYKGESFEDSYPHISIMHGAYISLSYNLRCR